jgi:superfamily I DNA and RNA helicase
MEINVNQNLLNRQPSSKKLIDIFQENEEEMNINNSILHHDFPLYLQEEGDIISANVLLVSRRHGIVIFQCADNRNINGEELDELNEKLDQIYSQIYSKLIRSKILRIKRRGIRISINTFLFLPNLRETLQQNEADIKIIKNQVELIKEFKETCSTSELDDRTVKETLAILEGTKNIVKPKDRNIKNKDKKSRGKMLEKIESEIANFDFEQKRAALQVMDGPQRIRGLAGSGKTIVLAMKAALIHLREPNVSILYTFYTKSLYDFIKSLITRFYRQYSEIDPNWEKINILHAWGGKNLPGVYYNICMRNNIEPISFSEARKIGKYPFNEVCKILESENIAQIYDYTIIDEGQDFPKYFYRLCREITKNNRVIWGYDECQNILNTDIQDTKDTFGKNDKGQYYVDFSKELSNTPCDIVLQKCYRNPRKILICAFSLGLGIYNDHILQMLENNEHWSDLGFVVKEGGSKKGDKMIIERPEQNSPLMQNELFDKEEDLITCEVFNNYNDECHYIADKIFEDINSDLLPEDILVISLDDFAARNYFEELKIILEKKDIKTYNLLEAPSNTKMFFLEDRITLSTVYRAKGNEAGSVYIIGVDAIFRGTNRDSIVERNKIFTAMTRAKGWVTITGVGAHAKECEKEINKTMENYPKIIFTMPDREAIKLFQRDLAKNQEQFNKLERMLEETAKKMGIDKEKLIEKLKEKRKNI